MSAPLKSFEGPDVQALLNRIRVELGPGAKISGAERVRVGGLFGFFAKEHFRVVAEAPPPDPGPVAESDRGTPVVPDAAAGVVPAMTLAADDLIDGISGPADPASSTESATAGGSIGKAHDPPIAGGPISGGDPDLSAEDPLEVPTDIAARAALFLAATTNEATRPFRPPDLPAGPPGNSLAPSLHRAGLGDDMIGRMAEGRSTGVDLEARLLEVFSTLPPAPPVPRRAGSLLVVVGDGSPARRLGAALAGEIGVDPTEVPFASLDSHAYVVATGRQLVRSPAEAAERAPGWRRSRPAVVVVDAPVTGARQSWAKHLIAALGPTAVWGIVASTCKTEDIVTWINGLGGMDALAVDDLGATVSPASVLNVGVPVARIDGHPATAARWAATVVGRITLTGHPS